MTKGFLAEFREFSERGNAIDMAVGVIAGAAMNGVVNSLVKDVIMPPIGLMLSDMDMSAISITLSGNTKIGIGLFMNSFIGFVLTMFGVFLFVRFLNRIQMKKASDKRNCSFCFSSISAKAVKCPNCCSAIEPIKGALSKNNRLDKIIGEIGEIDPIKSLKKVKKHIKKIVK